MSLQNSCSRFEPLSIRQAGLVYRLCRRFPIFRNQFESDIPLLDILPALKDGDSFGAVRFGLRRTSPHLVAVHLSASFDSTSSNNKHPIELLRNSRLYPRHEWRGFTRYQITSSILKGFGSKFNFFIFQTNH